MPGWLQMVMRVTALRGTVPQQWVADFQAAMEGYGVVALTQRAQLADVYAELAGNRRAGGLRAQGAPARTLPHALLASRWPSLLCWVRRPAARAGEADGTVGLLLMAAA